MSLSDNPLEPKDPDNDNVHDESVAECICCKSSTLAAPTHSPCVFNVKLLNKTKTLLLCG